MLFRSELTNRVSEFAGDRSFYNAVMLFVMNKARYEALPPDLKQVIDANSGAPLARQVGRMWDEWDEIGRAAVKKRNTPFAMIDGADLAAWKEATRPIVAKWIEDRTKAGEDGAGLLKAAQEILAKYAK